MTRGWRIVFRIALGLVLTAGAGAAIGGVLWRRATGRAVRQLDRAVGPAVAVAQRFDPGQLDRLPPPVARYFRFALVPGQPLVQRAQLRQVGSFAQRRDQWVPFTAVEEFAVRPPGFVWDARVRVAPLVTAYVRDDYLGSAAAMRVALMGVWPMVSRSGTAELATAALLRYLSEGAWLPTALLPAAGVEWVGVDDSTARATLLDGGTTASMEVRFGPAGEIVRVSAMRFRSVAGTDVLTPWVGYFRDYTRVAGMMVPLQGEVGWLLPDGWFPYYRGRIVGAEYQFASPAAVATVLR